MKKIKILLIEDSYESFEPIKDFLEIDGHEIDVIEDADEAFEKIKNLDGYKLILLDLMLPLGNKFELADNDEVGVFLYREIRKKYREIPIIIISALNKKRFDNNWKNDTCAKYISKPFFENIKEIRDAMEEFRLT